MWLIPIHMRYLLGAGVLEPGTLHTEIQAQHQVQITHRSLFSG